MQKLAGIQAPITESKKTVKKSLKEGYYPEDDEDEFDALSDFPDISAYEDPKATKAAKMVGKMDMPMDDEDDFNPYAFEMKGKMKKSEVKEMLKKAIMAEMKGEEEKMEETLEEASPEAMDRMDELVPRSQVKAMLYASDRIIYDLRKEGFEDEDIFDFLMDLIKTQPMGEGEEERAYEEAANMDETLNEAAEGAGSFLELANSIVRMAQDAGFDSIDISDAQSIANFLKGLAFTAGAALPGGAIAKAYRDFKKEQEPVDEAKKEDKEEEAVDVEDADIEDMEVADMPAEEPAATDGSAAGAFQDLVDAYESAKQIGDDKLTTQIANTIKYFNDNIILSK